MIEKIIDKVRQESTILYLLALEPGVTPFPSTFFKEDTSALINLAEQYSPCKFLDLGGMDGNVSLIFAHFGSDSYMVETLDQCCQKAREYSDRYHEFTVIHGDWKDERTLYSEIELFYLYPDSQVNQTIAMDMLTVGQKIAIKQAGYEMKIPQNLEEIDTFDCQYPIHVFEKKSNS